MSRTRKRKINASNNWSCGRFERLRLLTALSGSRYLKPPALPEVGEQEDAQDALDELVDVARNNYADFCRVARVLFKSKPDRTKLALLGNVPGDLQKFVTVATAS